MTTPTREQVNELFIKAMKIRSTLPENEKGSLVNYLLEAGMEAGMKAARADLEALLTTEQSATAIFIEVINHAITQGCDADAFLRCWREGDIKGCAEYGYVYRE